ncbi:DNA-3-methyladenine glycosylase [Geodermatophilus aquaeductus]|uniref:DNA-3-methyladenine glycosylase II n=1 Tax=Geodermatophilus aquaeductus TaxID=1564161 RepID=A0A521FVN7_9ACTN|nr:DNA-3-methyladenine glycosylase [Geodermatophilus aquaeductus]SMO99671.1 DNA-3-methyladenine glycosylase II [Geodermatophilus aquaeductus]
MIALPVRGPFDLAQSARFLEGFAPARHRGAPDGVLRLACWIEGSDTAAGIAVSQDADGAVRLRADAGPPRLAEQVARILGLDVDGAGFAGVTATDPVLAPLAAARPGFRPVSFWSPYEAACWAVFSQRISRVAAAGTKARIAERFGTVHDVDGEATAAFPTPSRLVAVAGDLPVPPVKQERLRGLAEAALDGRLDGGRLRSLPVGQALAEVRELPGIGPFSADLVVVRGAGAPDVLPTAEPRLREEMAHRYGLADPSPAELARIAEAWRPYRSWAAVLLRAAHDERTARGR